VSRTVIREALAELAGQGLVRTQQGSASTITLPGSKQLERIIRLRFALQGGTSETAQELRESIEVAAARLAAARASQEHVDAVRARLADLRGASDVDALHRADLAFHRAVVEAAGNDLMGVTLDAMTPLLDELLAQVWQGWLKSDHETAELVEAHAAILDAIEAGDGDAAADAMWANLQQGRVGLSGL
jgi:GntR family transcriptional regulator, transcriptional repressor for pyruvate dehydrogenase complex